MIILIDQKKHLAKLHHVVIKILGKLDIEETYHNIIKAMDNKPTADTLLSGESFKYFSNIRDKTRVPSLTTPI